MLTETAVFILGAIIGLLCAIASLIGNKPVKAK
jgi:ABC-type amino acid transport system permease subunit